jgi:hypothetical protein
MDLGGHGSAVGAARGKKGSLKVTPTEMRDWHRNMRGMEDVHRKSAASAARQTLKAAR